MPARGISHGARPRLTTAHPAVNHIIIIIKRLRPPRRSGLDAVWPRRRTYRVTVREIAGALRRSIV
jgi:hypothetical protein